MHIEPSETPYDERFLLRWRGFSRSGTRTLSSVDFEMYFEYAPFNTLQQLIEKFDRTYRKPAEFFVQIVFRNLLKACQKLEAFGWVHTEIMPQNVFLMDRPTRDYSAYFKPVLGGFAGLKRLNSKINGIEGIEGWRVPEQNPSQSNLPADTDRSGIHVYAIAQIIWALMHTRTNGFSKPPYNPGNETPVLGRPANHVIADDLKYRGPDNDNYNFEIDEEVTDDRGRTLVEAPFSDALKELVLLRLEARRPTMADVLDQVEEMLRKPLLKNTVRHQDLRADQRINTREEYPPRFPDSDQQRKPWLRWEHGEA